MASVLSLIDNKTDLDDDDEDNNMSFVIKYVAQQFILSKSQGYLCHTVG